MIKTEIDELIASETRDNKCEGIKRLESRFFKDFGCINMQSDEYFKELNLARAFHKWHKENWPEKHDEHEEEPYRCYHQTVCKCGYSEAYDSGD